MLSRVLTCHSVLNPVHLGFCPQHSTKTTLAKVKNALHFAKYDVNSQFPLSFTYEYQLLQLLPLACLETFPLFGLQDRLLSSTSSASSSQSVDCSSSMYHLRVC